jgi:hypothetical protein
MPRAILQVIEELLEKWFLVAVIISGMLSAFVIAFPKVLTVAFLLLLLPGIFLSLMPTTFLWLICYGGFWFVSKYYSPSQKPLVISLCIGLLLVFGIPLTHRLIVTTQLAPFVETDILPSQPIVITGDIRLDSLSTTISTGPNNTVTCTRECIDLLFFDGVTSVTVTMDGLSTPLRGLSGSISNTRTPIARVFRIVPSSQCNVEGAITRIYANSNNPATVAMQMRLASGFCIAPSAAGNEAINVTLSYRDYKIAVPPSALKLVGMTGVDNADVTVFKILDANNHIVFSEQRIVTGALGAPLFYTSEGNVFEGPTFTWWRQSIEARGRSVRGLSEIDWTDILAKYTNFKVGTATSTTSQSAVPTQSAALILRAALSDPSKISNDPAFGAVEIYLKHLSTSNPSEEDLALVRDLILDKRIEGYPHLGALISKLGPRSQPLIAPLLTRLKAAAPKVDKDFIVEINNLIALFPIGSFATPTPEATPFLQSDELRLLAPGLVKRQADRGPEALPFLLQTLRFHAQSRKANQDPSKTFINDEALVHKRLFTAALVGICRLGPQASSALPILKELGQSGLLSELDIEQEDWHVTLIRLGTPISSITKPSSSGNSLADYQKRIRTIAQSTDVDRACDYY